MVHAMHNWLCRKDEANMAPLLVKVTAHPDVPILGCPRCDTALLPFGEWPKGGPAAVRCPLCSWEQEVDIVEVGGGEEAFPFNPAQQRLDLEASPIYAATDIARDEDLILVDVPGLLEDPAFMALQQGVAPVSAFGWAGGSGLLDSDGYRLFLVVRVTDMPENDLFRVEFPPELLPALGEVTEENTVVLVSERKGVLFPEAGEVYLTAVRAAGGTPGAPVVLNEWVKLEGAAE
jgi:hypothetical protein